MAALAVAVFVFGMLVTVRLAGRAQAAPESRDQASKYYPPLVQNWRVFGPLKRQGNAAQYAIGLLHRGVLPYPVIERKKDIIPAMRTQLILPAGVKLLTRGSYKSRFSDHLWRSYWHRPIPKTNLRWRIIHGAPTWKVLRVGANAPRVAFWVSGKPGQCFQAKTMGLYRRNRRWIRIPDAPVQTARTCLPSPTSTTTTSNTTPGWTNIVDDQFNSGGIPRHWSPYSNPYRSAPNNCTDPAHDFVSGGYLHLVESYESSKPAGVNCPYGAGWYTGGLTLPYTPPYSASNQRVTVRFRIVSVGGVVPHYIIPMRRADNSEEDFFESDVLSFGHTFLHYAGGRIRSDPAYSIDVTKWHTVRFTQLNHVVSVYVDDMAKPMWRYDGNPTTTPDATQWRHVLLQQECSHANGCPRGTSGSSDIQVDWITVDNAS
jgi:hypothetical protein